MRLAPKQDSEVLRRNQRLDALSPAFVFSGSCRQSKDACLQPVPCYTMGFYITYLRADGWPKLYDNVERKTPLKCWGGSFVYIIMSA